MNAFFLPVSEKMQHTAAPIPNLLTLNPETNRLLLNSKEPEYLQQFFLRVP